MSNPNAPYGPVPPPGPPRSPGQSPVPAISLILGILSIVCGGFVLGIPAIITGAMGRKKAKQSGQGAGMAIGGMITGIAGSILSVVIIVLFVTGAISIFSTVKDQVVIAEQLNNATFAAEVYVTDHESYAGLTADGLREYGYVPSPEVTVSAEPTQGGSGYCISGYLNAKPDTVIHVPADPNGWIEITVNGRQFRYSTGGCPSQ